MEQKLVAIDGATNKTGISFFENGKLKDYELLNFSECKDTSQRFALMAKAIWDKLDKYKPQTVYMEETYTAVNPQTAKTLTRLQGFVYAWCLNNSCEFVTILPSRWRKVLGFNQGKGVKREELKQQSVEFVSNKYNIKVNDDVADSICIGEAAILIQKKEKK